MESDLATTRRVGRQPQGGPFLGELYQLLVLDSYLSHFNNTVVTTPMDYICFTLTIFKVNVGLYSIPHCNRKIFSSGLLPPNKFSVILGEEKQMLCHLELGL